MGYLPYSLWIAFFNDNKSQKLRFKSEVQQSYR